MAGAKSLLVVGSLRQNEHLRIMDQRADARQFLLHASGIVGRELFKRVGEFQLLNQRPGAAFDLAGR